MATSGRKDRESSLDRAGLSRRIQRSRKTKVRKIPSAESLQRHECFESNGRRRRNCFRFRGRRTNRCHHGKSKSAPGWFFDRGGLLATVLSRSPRNVSRLREVLEQTSIRASCASGRHSEKP